jgi:hypothetical protein
MPRAAGKLLSVLLLASAIVDSTPAKVLPDTPTSFLGSILNALMLSPNSRNPQRNQSKEILILCFLHINSQFNV